jgi:hypothetical protein
MGFQPQRTMETRMHRTSHRNQNEDETVTTRPTNRALSYGPGSSPEVEPQPAQLGRVATPRVAATATAYSTSQRTCVIEINIFLGPGGRLSQLPTTSNRASPSAAASPIRSSTTIDNVHLIDIDLRLPKHTAYIKTDGLERR